MPNTTQAYQASLTKFIQAHMVMLGPRVILSLVSAIPGIQVTNTGVVNQLNQDPVTVIQHVSSAFAPYGGPMTLRIHTQLFKDLAPSGGTNTKLGQL